MAKKPDDVVAQIKMLMPQLDAQGRALVRQWIDVMSQFDPVVTIKRGKIDHSADDEGIILASFQRVMAARGLELSSPYHVRRLRGYGAFKKKVPSLMNFARDAAPTSRIVQHAILDLGWGLVARYMDRMLITVTPQSVLNHAHMMAPCINQAFPGYIRNGLLKFVVSPE